MLNVSRSTVFNRCKQLQSVGVAVERVRGKGYRIVNNAMLVTVDMLQNGVLHQDSGRLHWSWKLMTDSTNDDAKVISLCDEKDVAIAYAEYQGNGRGRRGRVWHSPLGENIYLSFKFSIQRPLPELPSLGLEYVINIAEAFEKTLGIKVQLKWPNDLYSNSRKVGGLLMEIVGEMGGAYQVVLGIGLNIGLSENSVHIDQPWSNLVENPNKARKLAITLCLINTFLGLLKARRKGVALDLTSRWKAYDLLVGKLLTIYHNGREISGYSAGVSGEGYLLFRAIDGDIMKLHAGEVTIRKDFDSE
jgi:BirA family biotin operon repressor/biotin-[acetyl-CoA-carboxylase] ligase